MTIPPSERQKMLAVRLCGPRVIARLESIGITKLRDLAERDPDQLVHEVNITAGRPIWRPPMAAQAMTNLIAAARQEPSARDWPSPPAVIPTTAELASADDTSIGCEQNKRPALTSARAPTSRAPQRS